ncbi:hypothetical protein CspeluHIS016_0210810 [Cutaneotrichosporon spelunceum]|uniref:alcohol dehydrogenase n=1 Tax=Cutaneotrichosporon spelunceum TaxID=1672016 RepID=A0AAD3TSH2_9TREE|nr:hypothetical protein CspeluHIS016_0210810 [Cutaneotrichosporon spelunceum]
MANSFSSSLAIGPDPIPREQLAAVSHSASTGTVLETIPVVQPSDLKPGEALVKLIYSGVCGSSYHQASDHWAEGKGRVPRPLIAGDEGVGTLVAINDPTSRFKIGDTVGIKFVAATCNQCTLCLAGLEMVCPQAKYTGRSVNGTFQQYSLAWTSQLTPIPPNMNLAQAAPILCAGVTVWRALKDSTASAGDWVAVPGAGGGLGSLAVQYAKYLGMRVIAVDSKAKDTFCTDELGADAFVDYAAVDYVQQIKKIADGVGVQATILCSNEPTSYVNATDYLRPTGSAMIVGLPPTGSHVPVDCRNAVLGMHTVRGCFVGTRGDVIDALDVVARGKVVPKVTVKPFSAIQETYDCMAAGTLCGRVVVDMWE